MKVNILGTEYTIKKENKRDNKKLESVDGYCDTSVKQIIVNDIQKDDWTIEDLDSYIKNVTRHEIIHAFLYESGLSVNSNGCEDWATNEEMVDWLAIQFSKILNAFNQAECL